MDTDEGLIRQDGLEFRDLDHDGVLAPYEDWRLAPAQRAGDLLARLTLAEKVGLMLHGTAPAEGGPLAVIGVGQAYDAEGAERLIAGWGVNSLITRLAAPPAAFAEQNNRLQAIAARTRLGIPLTISSDPRHHFGATVGASVSATGFSLWPETLGLAAIGDLDLVRRFGDIVRQDYRAVGIHMALGPQADLATSPRWSRIIGTFGEDPGVVRRMVGAYVAGLQGGEAGLEPGGVASIVKHWVGYGAAPDGYDGHNYYGRFSAFPASGLDQHIDAFRDAFAGGVAGVMPTYNILRDVELDGRPLEAVGAGFSRQLLTDLLRRDLGYQGLLLSDWAITRDCGEAGRTGSPRQGPDDIGMPWGVEGLSAVERFAKGLAAGLDQFGGENDPAALLEAVERGLVAETRIDLSVLRILELKFRLGLFETPYVSPEAAERLAGSAASHAEAEAAQRRSLTWIEPPPAPITGRDRVYCPDIAAPAAWRVVDDPADATVAVLRTSTPRQRLHPGFFFGARQAEGDLDFKDGDPEFERLKDVCARVPTILCINLDRPAILTGLRERTRGILGLFGASDTAITDVLSGQSEAQGALPFSLPASMDAVCARPVDQPHADPNPLYPIGRRW